MRNTFIAIPDRLRYTQLVSVKNVEGAAEGGGRSRKLASIVKGG
jgi:hypothetical protein